MKEAQRSLAVLVLVAALFASLAALTRPRAAIPRASSLAVRSSRVALPADDPARARLGSLSFRGGLVLESDDSRFGGLSDLRLSPDGRRLLAVSDCGYGFSAELRYDAAGAPESLAEPRLVDLTGPGGRPLRVGENDAESLVADGPFLEVGFEGRGRLWRYAVDPPFGPTVEPLAAPAGIASCGPNLGLEASARVDASSRLLVCEGERTPSLTAPAWVGAPGAWSARRYPLHFDGGWAGEPFRPTGAAALDGEVFVVERRFPPFASRVVRVTRASLGRKEGPLETVEVASLQGSSLADNYEGIDVRRDDRGRTLVYLLSDDNSCAKPGGSRVALALTRLLVFELVD